MKMKNDNFKLFNIFINLFLYRLEHVECESDGSLFLLDRNMDPLNSEYEIMNKQSFDDKSSYVLRSSNVQETNKAQYDDDDDLKAILEDKYKFRNDEISTRFRIADHTRTYPGSWFIYIKYGEFLRCSSRCQITLKGAFPRSVCQYVDVTPELFKAIGVLSAGVSHLLPLKRFNDNTWPVDMESL